MGITRLEVPIICSQMLIEAKDQAAQIQKNPIGYGMEFGVYNTPQSETYAVASGSQCNPIPIQFMAL